MRVRWRRLRTNVSRQAYCRTCARQGTLLIVHLRNKRGVHGVVVMCTHCDMIPVPLDAETLPKERRD